MVVTGDITQIDLPQEQKSGLVVVGDILAGVDGVEFVRFGGDDVVRHKLVQRIVAAYDEHAAQAGAAARAGGPPPPPGVNGLDVEVLGDHLPAEQVRRACVLAAATAGVEDGHVAVTFVTPEEIAALNAEHRGKEGPTDVLSFPVDGDGAGRRRARARATS